MKERLTRNLDLKILALLFAIVLWLIVVNIDDPVKSTQFSGIEVKILNESELEKQGLCYEILDDSDIVTAYVTGRRSVIEDLSRDNIVATADLKDLTSMNTVPVRVSSNKSQSELDGIRVNEDTVKINVEKLQKKTKRIILETEGTPAEGYIVGSRTMNLNQVEISGPESLISTVDTAKIVVDVDNATSGVSASVPIRLYDAAGERVNSSRINMNISTVSVNQEILFSKDVEVVYEFSGEPEEGYALTGEIISDVKSVNICGKKSLLDNISTITVKGDELNVNGAKVNYSVVVDLNDYLPSNVEFSDKTFDGKAKVLAVIRKEDPLSVNISVSRIRFEGLPDDKTAEITEDGIHVNNDVYTANLLGLSEALEEVAENRVSIWLDFDAYKKENNLEELGNGNYTILPKILLPDGVHLDTDDTVHVRIMDK